MRPVFLVGATAVLAALVLGAARADETRDAPCPACGVPVPFVVPAASNEGGGVDSDGCRWAVGTDGRLFVPELRELVACPSSACGAAFYRARLEGSCKLASAPVVVGPALAALGPASELAPRAAVVARAIATYRAHGLELAPGEDAGALEGRLWLRAAWAVREAALREDDVRRLPFLYAPRDTADGGAQLAELDRRFLTRGALGTRSSPLEEALASVDEARQALVPLEPREPDAPSRLLLYGRAQETLDQLERMLFSLRAELRETRDVAGGELSSRELALALARAALRAGDTRLRERWLDAATRGTEVPETVRGAADRLRALAAAEAKPLANARGAFEAAADRAQGEPRTELLVLAADAARRTGDLERARELLGAATKGAPGAGLERAHALLALVGEAK